ncbi:MAG: hypothetical protein HYR91_05655 [Flavobacteriia bacterium]|nr:hypothetical protein [Flavobacteriia bacterium]
MKLILISISICYSFLAISQEENMSKYDSLINLALKQYELKEYKASAELYSKAFKSIGWKSYPRDKYNAACTWSLANQPDSAFYYLTKIVTKLKYNDLNAITSDKDFISIHDDKRWKLIIKEVKKNKAEVEKEYDHKLINQLEIIQKNDQQYRAEELKISEKYGRESRQFDSIWKIIQFHDSINICAVEKILTKHGWLSPKIIGYKGVNTIFLVIQHADLKVQEKYLPILREAAKNKELNYSTLALLEDRIANRNGLLQIYGTQIGYNKEKDVYYLMPVEDPDNLDKRRNEVNLGPIAEYLALWKIEWNLEEYKQNLPYYISITKKYE